MRYKTNKNVFFKRDNLKSYIYVEEKGKTIGVLMWCYASKKWVFEDHQKRRRNHELF